MEEEKEKLISEAERNASILVEIEKAMGPNPSPKDFKILIIQGFNGKKIP